MRSVAIKCSKRCNGCLDEFQALHESRKERSRLESYCSDVWSRPAMTLRRAERQYQAVEPETDLVARIWRKLGGACDRKRHSRKSMTVSRQRPQRGGRRSQERIAALRREGIPRCGGPKTTIDGGFARRSFDAGRQASSWQLTTASKQRYDPLAWQEQPHSKYYNRPRQGISAVSTRAKAKEQVEAVARKRL